MTRNKLTPVHPYTRTLTSTGRGASDVAEQVGGGIPEDAVEAQNHLVEIAKAQPLDGVLLPRGQRRIELDRVQLV